MPLSQVHLSSIYLFIVDEYNIKPHIPSVCRGTAGYWNLSSVIAQSTPRNWSICTGVRSMYWPMVAQIAQYYPLARNLPYMFKQQQVRFLSNFTSHSVQEFDSLRLSNKCQRPMRFVSCKYGNCDRSIILAIWSRLHSIESFDPSFNPTIRVTHHTKKKKIWTIWYESFVRTILWLHRTFLDRRA